MSESPIEQPKPKSKAGCTFRIHHALCLRTTGQWIPAGVVADLSDCGDKFLRWALENRLIETADPSDEEPLFSQIVGAVKRKPCPCRK